MKYIAIFLIPLSLIALWFCKWKQPQKPLNETAVSILYDVTDPLLSKPDSASIKSQFSELSADNSTGAILHIGLLDEAPYALQMQTEIKPEPFLLSNPGQRTLAVRTFFQEVDTDVAQLDALPLGLKKHSELFVPIAREANRLVSLPVAHKELIIYSNLYENAQFSMYRGVDLAMLTDNPEKVKNLFLSKQPLNDLKGLQVDIIYEPTDYADGQQFQKISALYEQIFTEAGATVTISANLINQ